MKYQFIQDSEPLFPIHSLCQMMQVSRSAYYEYKTGKSHQVSQSEKEARKAVESAFWDHKQRYGSRRLRVELQETLGLPMGRHRLRRLMKEQKLVAIQRQRPTVKELCSKDDG